MMRVLYETNRPDRSQKSCPERTEITSHFDEINDISRKNRQKIVMPGSICPSAIRLRTDDGPQRTAQVVMPQNDATTHPWNRAAINDWTGLTTRAKFDEIHAQFVMKVRGFRSFSRGFPHFRTASEGDAGLV